MRAMGREQPIAYAAQRVGMRVFASKLRGSRRNYLPTGLLV